MRNLAPTTALVPVSGLPEVTRIQFVRSDLDVIAEQSAQQVEVHQTALTAANEVVRQSLLAAQDLPNRDTIIGLTQQREPEVVPERQHQPTPRRLAQAFVAPRHRRVGVSRNETSRGALKDLHSDTNGDKQAHNTYQAITKARADGDETLIQGLYAGTVAAKAKTSPKLDASTLELSRYKAWLALQAGEGRFRDHAEVAAWKENQLAMIPHRLRGEALGTTAQLFHGLLGKTRMEGGIPMPSANYVYAVSDGFEATAKAVRKVLDDNTTPANLPNSDLELFDARLREVLSRLAVLADNPIESMAWSSVQASTVYAIATRLPVLARALEGYKPKPKQEFAYGLHSLGSIALQEIMTQYNYSPEQPEQYSPKEQIIRPAYQKYVDEYDNENRNPYRF